MTNISERIFRPGPRVFHTKETPRRSWLNPAINLQGAIFRVRGGDQLSRDAQRHYAAGEKMVPAIVVSGEAGSVWRLESATAFGSLADWTTLAEVTMNETTQTYFDLTQPLPPQRFHRALLPTTPGISPTLGINPVSALTLTGGVGSHWRIEAINRVGPVDACLVSLP